MIQNSTVIVPYNSGLYLTTRAIGDTKTCSICLSDFEQGDHLAYPKNTLSSGCQHMFHYECLKGWLMKKKDCPVCRRKVLISDKSTPVKSMPNMESSQQVQSPRSVASNDVADQV